MINKEDQQRLSEAMENKFSCHPETIVGVKVEDIVSTITDLQAENEKLKELIPHTCETCKWDIHSRCEHADHPQKNLTALIQKGFNGCPIDRWELGDV